MYYSLKGIVTVTESTYIVLDVNNVGYLIYTPNPYSFKVCLLLLESNKLYKDTVF